jgi:hypothetical protein
MAGTVRQSAYASVAQKAINADNATKANSANTAISSSYAATASLLLGSVQSASYAATASYYGGSITSASYAATASYSKTLGASLGNDDTGLLKLINSAGTTISSVTALTSSLAINAITASYVTPYEGAWRSYSISWTTDGVTQPVIGNGSLTGAYKQIGKIVFVRVKLNCGSTTTFGTGAWQFGLPITASSPDGVQFACSMLDSSTTWYGGTVNGTYSGATFKTAIITPQPLTHTQAAVTATSPFAWGDTDSLQFNGSYESI